jgi:hypothetical protein
MSALMAFICLILIGVMGAAMCDCLRPRPLTLKENLHREAIFERQRDKGVCASD